MSTITLQDAQARLPEIVAGLKPGEKLVVVNDDHAVAIIVGTERPTVNRSDLPKGVPILGRGIGMMIIHEDDDEHLELFKEYMP